MLIQWRIKDFPLGGGGADQLGGGGANLRCIHFLAKMYVKMKEIDPVGGGGVRTGSAPPGSANVLISHMSEDDEINFYPP